MFLHSIYPTDIRAYNRVKRARWCCAVESSAVYDDRANYDEATLFCSVRAPGGNSEYYNQG